MKKLLIMILLVSQTAIAQRKEIEFGQISPEEIKMKHYEQDKEAKAVILYDKGKSVFYDTENGYDIRFTRHKRMKIFDRSKTEYAEVSIPFFVDGYGKTERVTSIEAVTYNTTGGILKRKKLDPSQVYEERINERWRAKKFVFPDVQDGAILEYRYVLETPFHFNLPDWTFQDKIPTVYSEYQVAMIPFYEYVFLVQGITEFDYQHSETSKEKRSWGSVVRSMGQNVGSGIEFQDVLYTYVLKDIPAFADESYISSINNYIVKMDFQLARFHSPTGSTSDIMSSWPALNESLLKHEKFGKYMKSSSKIARKILSEKLNISDLDPGQKARKIIEYVKDNFDWNGYYGKYVSQSAKDFLDKKGGSAADINLFLIALLNEAEIETTPLILSTRDHGRIPDNYPFDHFTNYVIALVGTDSPFLADATEDLLPYNKLPIRCNNEKGLIVKKEKTPGWISLENNVLSISKNTIRMTLDPDNMDLNGQVSIQNTEYESYAARSRFRNDTSAIKKIYSEKVGTITKARTVWYDQINMPYSMSFKNEFETEKLGKNILIKPFLNLPLSRNSLTQKKRAYPVDFVYPWEDQFESAIELPEDVSVTQLPENYEMDNSLAKINLHYSLENNLLTVKGSYRLKKSTYVADEYSRIKNYLDEVVRRFNEPVVLKKST